MSVTDVARMFPTDKAAERWFVRERWPNGIACHYCGSTNVQTGAKHKTMPYGCRDCWKRFSVRTGTIMESSKLGFQVWAFALYMLTTNIRGVSSMKLHRDLGVTQKTAWHLAHRIRETFAPSNKGGNLAGPLEVDETYVGGKASNMHARDVRKAARSAVAAAPSYGELLSTAGSDRRCGKRSGNHAQANRHASVLYLKYE